MRDVPGLGMLFLLVVASATAQYQPVTGGDFTDLEARDELATPGDLADAQRVLRFIQVSDAHIIDDDAPYPMRQEILDDYITAFSTSAQRPQDEYTDEVLNRAIAAINAIHAEDALDFVINTGDNIDNQQENELMRFLDNWEGTLTTVGPISGLTCVEDGQSVDVEDTSNDETEDCTYLPSAVSDANVPLAPGLPWFSAFGNHDGLVQGNVPIEPGFQEIAGQSGRYLLTQEEYVAMHFRAGQQCVEGDSMGDVLDDFGHGYGFARQRLCDDDPDNDGYYSFSLAGVHFIILDTMNDDFVSSNENLQGLFVPQQTAGYDLIGGYAEGAIDPAQAAWLEAEIDAHRDRLVVLMSHHTINSMFTEPTAAGCCGPNGESLEDLLNEAGFVTGKGLAEMLADKPNVVAWIGGHTHKHRVEAKNVGAGESQGFWNIETSSLIDSPQEFRTIEVWVTADGAKGFLTMRSATHDFEESRALADADPQRDQEASGTALDQEVLLWFDVPPGVRLSPQPSLPRFLVLDLDVPPLVNGSHGLINEPMQIQLDVTDSLLGAPVPDLNVTFRIQHADPEDFQRLILDLDETVTGDGSYALTFTPVDGATHFVSIRVEDPSGLFEPAATSASLVIDDPAMDEDLKEDSPAVALLGVLAVLVIAALRRR